MYINGKRITLDELESLANKLIGSIIDDLYNEIGRRAIREHEIGRMMVSILAKTT